MLEMIENLEKIEIMMEPVRGTALSTWLFIALKIDGSGLYSKFFWNAQWEMDIWECITCSLYLRSINNVPKVLKYGAVQKRMTDEYSAGSSLCKSYIQRGRISANITSSA